MIRDVRDAMLDGLPGRAANGGFIYVIGFDNGTVKVGNTINPAARFNDHAGSASAFNIVIADWWLSAEHREYLDSETALIAAAGSMGGTRTRREYFHGLQFEKVVIAAKSIVASGGMFAHPRQNQRGERLFTLHEVNRMCGFFAVEWLLESCLTGSIEHRFIDGRYYLSEADFNAIVDRHLGPDPADDDFDIRKFPQVEADFAWVCGLSVKELRRRTRTNEPLFDSVQLVRS